MINPLKQSVWRSCVALAFVGLCGQPWIDSSFAQELRYDDRIGSNKAFDMCEDARFKRITKLVEDGKISQRQGYNIWKRIESDKQAVRKVLVEAVAAKELTYGQVERLLPLLDAEMSYVDSQHGRFGQPKPLREGQFKTGEVSTKNRAAVYRRLRAANERGLMYDYDVASIMNQLYAGFDEATASVEEVAKYRTALNPRIEQSGSESRVLQSVQMQRAQRGAERKNDSGYGAAEIKIAAPSDWIRNLETPVYSGPQPGEKVVSLTAINLRGDEAGREFDPIALAGDKLHLMLFVSKSRTFGRFLGQLRKQLQSIEESSKQPWAMSVIVCTDDANEAEKSFDVLDQRYPKNLLVGLCKDGSAGPPAYGLDRNLTATVIVVKDGRVAYNLPYAGDAFYSQPHILGAIAAAMGVDHETLRRFIGDTPGDAAGVAYARNRQRSRDQSETPPRPGFRKKLAPLVLDEKLTRAEAAELFRASGDEQALRAKVEELVTSRKLTREQAGELLRDDSAASEQSDGAQSDRTRDR